MPECEAERRITQALYEMELDWGSGRFDYTKIRGILRDTPPCPNITELPVKLVL